MGCCASGPISVDLGKVPPEFQVLSDGSDPKTITEVEDILTAAFVGNTKVGGEGVMAWVHDLDGNVDGDYAKPLKEEPSQERIYYCRYIVKWCMAQALKHGTCFALNDPESSGKIVAVACCLPPNNTNLADPGVCEMMSWKYKGKDGKGIDAMPPEFKKKKKDPTQHLRQKAVDYAFKKGKFTWAQAFPYWYVMGMGVHPDRQGKGHGRHLMEFLTNVADRNDTYMYLETHGAKNRKFFEHHNFRVMESKYLKAKDCVPLEKHGGLLVMTRLYQKEMDEIIEIYKDPKTAPKTIETNNW
mmetsp:Transcript_19076/g.39738  ORF Transcript_19076/g.39738 Transcript_19076/m.39738 type:complete len:299 (-) Transcript_19076:65-961(-)